MRGWAALLLASALGCSDEGSLSPADFQGSWALVSDANSSCLGASGAANRFFEIEDPAAGYSDGVFNVVAAWDFVRPYRYSWTVSGNFNLEQRTVELNFWLRPLEVGAVFTGHILSDGSVAGTLRDPKPGYQPHTVIGSCTFEARLQRAP